MLVTYAKTLLDFIIRILDILDKKSVKETTKKYYILKRQKKYKGNIKLFLNDVEKKL